jgi:hypothetical protein
MSKRVAHFIPAYQRRVDVDVAMAIARDCEFATAHKWKYMPFYVDTTGIARARNQAVREALEHGAELLLMQDSDTFANPAYTYSALERLWKTMHTFEAAVVGAAVPIRNRVDGMPMNCHPYEFGRRFDGEVGTGLMLIDLVKLAALQRPWFVQEDSADGEGVEVGEDIAFCRRVRDGLGLRVIVDASIPMIHGYMTMHMSKLPDDGAA